jgi:hypothetical protein
MDQSTRRLDDPDEEPAGAYSRTGPLDDGPSLPVCPACGGHLIRVRARFGTGDLHVEQFNAPARDLLLHKAVDARGRSPLEATVCTECGLTQLYATRLAQLLEL